MLVLALSLIASAVDWLSLSPVATVPSPVETCLIVLVAEETEPAASLNSDSILALDCLACLLLHTQERMKQTLHASEASSRQTATM